MNILLDHFHEAVSTPKDIEKLKKYILQLAMQGKLVEQDPNDEPASELLERVETEKERLIKEKKIKRQKALSPVDEGEIPYELPHGWEWVRLSQISIINPRNQIDDNLDVSFVPMKLIKDGFRNEHNFETRKWSEIKKGFTHFQENDIVIAKITPCFENRKSAIMKNLKNGYGAGTTELHVIRLFSDSIDASYLLWIFKSDDFINNGTSTYTGTAGQQRVSKDFIENYLIPIPPLSEQKKIMQKVDYLFRQCDQLQLDIVRNRTTSAALNKSVFTRIQDHRSPNQLDDLRFAIENMDHLCNHKESIDQLRNSLLTLAFQGRLMKQDENDEPAIELLRKIQYEKERFFEENKINKEIPLKPIKRDIIPHGVPNGWEWVSLGIISYVQMGQSPKGESYNDNGEGVPLINGPVEFGPSAFSETKMTKFTTAPTKMCDKGDLLICVRGSSTGRMNLAGFRACIGRGVASVKPFVNQKYVHYFLHYSQKQILESGKGSTFPNITADQLKDMLVPIPPLNEQRRIVEKIDNLFTITSQLVKRLDQENSCRKGILESILQSGNKRKNDSV